MQFLINLNIAMRGKLADSNLIMLKRSFYAGCFIATGALLYSLMTSVSGNETFTRLLGSLLFTVGLILVYFMKVQLFTGNNLMLASWLDKKISGKEIFRNWFIVYMGNFLGAFVFAFIAFLIFNNIDQISIRLGAIAELKGSYEFGTAFIKALFCNFLVCMAIFLAIVLDTKIKKTIGIIIPITIFVFMGFEHSIANMFFIPVGFMSSGLDTITAAAIFLNNIVPVTLGNITGGFIFSALIFGFNRIKS